MKYKKSCVLMCFHSPEFAVMFLKLVFSKFIDTNIDNFYAPKKFSYAKQIVFLCFHFEV